MSLVFFEYPTWMRSAFFNYSDIPATYPRIRILNEAGNAVEISCYGTRWRVYAYTENISSEHVETIACEDYDTATTYKVRVRIYTKDEQNRYTVLKDEKFFEYYPHYLIRIPQQNINILTLFEREKWDQLGGEVIVIDEELMHAFRIPMDWLYGLPNSYPHILSSGKHIIIGIARKNELTGEILDPPQVKIIRVADGTPTTILDTTRVKYVYFTSEIRFRSVTDMYNYLITALADYPYAVQIHKSTTLTLIEKCKLLTPLLTQKIHEVLGSKVLNAWIEGTTLKLTVEFNIGEEEWWMILVGIGLIIGGILLTKTGIGATIGIPAIAKGLTYLGLTSIALGVVTWTAKNITTIFKGSQATIPWEVYVRQVEQVVEEAKADISVKFDEYLSYLDQLYQQNKIPQDVYNDLKSRTLDLKQYVLKKLDDIKVKTVEIVRTIEKTVKETIIKEDLTKVMLSGIAGFGIGAIIGVTIGRR